MSSKIAGPQSDLPLALRSVQAVNEELSAVSISDGSSSHTRLLSKISEVLGLIAASISIIETSTSKPKTAPKKKSITSSKKKTAADQRG